MNILRLENIEHFKNGKWYKAKLQKGLLAKKRKKAKKSPSFSSNLSLRMTTQSCFFMSKERRKVTSFNSRWPRVMMVMDGIVINLFISIQMYSVLWYIRIAESGINGSFGIWVTLTLLQFLETNSTVTMYLYPKFNPFEQGITKKHNKWTSSTLSLLLQAQKVNNLNRSLLCSR